jgi:predicted ribosome-associated RNA-binding protein Tma20
VSQAEDLELQKLNGQKLNLISQKNPMFFVPDGLTLGPKLDCLISPTLYLLYETHVAQSSSGLIRVFVKGGVENFIFNGADLMWPGVAYCDAE